MSEYYLKNKEKILAYQKQYRETHKEQILEYQKKYQKKYYDENKDTIIEKIKQTRMKMSKSKLMNKRKRLVKSLLKNEMKVQAYKQKLIDEAIANENIENEKFEELCLNAYPDSSDCILF
jgi:hypothetical protein